MAAKLRGTRAKNLAAARRRLVRRVGIAYGRKVVAANQRKRKMPSMAQPGFLIRNLNGNLTESAFNRVIGSKTPAVKRTEELTTPLIVSTQETARQDNAFGFQKANSFQLLTQADLNTMWKQLLGSGALNSSSMTPGASYVPNRFLIETCQVAINFANVSTAPVELTLYDIVLKRDLPTQLTWNVGIPLTPAVFTPYPEEYWAVGSNLNNGVSPLTPGPTPSQYLGARPTDSTPFNNYFKIVAKKRIMLSQGGVHRHTISLKVNRFIDSFMINATGAPDNSFPWGQRKLAHYLMYNSVGMPCSDLSGVNVTSSDTHLDIIASYRYKCSAVINNQHYVRNYDTLTTPANANIVNIGSGKVEAITFVP